ncbi:unnamed protein product [Polarella glacialis]|uniref:Uncharacterized protein n=1 Tax=Polarella glacialis TaxID=89957 RepID=A0A813DBI9_POLGL|nr:unnamed protein product [Polarella glacialis]
MRCLEFLSGPFSKFASKMRLGSLSRLKRFAGFSPPRRVRSPRGCVVLVFAAALTLSLALLKATTFVPGGVADLGHPALLQHGQRYVFSKATQQLLPQLVSTEAALKAETLLTFSQRRPVASRRSQLCSLFIPALVAPLIGCKAALASEAKEVISRSDVRLSEILGDWDSYASAGGDSVRRALGTSSPSSPLYELTAAMKKVCSENMDLMDQVELIEEKRRQADFLAYSSIFCGTAAGGGTGGGGMPCDKRFLLDARDEVEALRSEVQKLLVDAA